MDNLNTTQITLGNMTSVDVSQEEPQESRDTQTTNPAQGEPESSKDTGLPPSDDKPENNMLIFGGLLVLLLLFKKKL
jgi:hypothetical protein